MGTAALYRVCSTGIYHTLQHVHGTCIHMRIFACVQRHLTPSRTKSDAVEAEETEDAASHHRASQKGNCILRTHTQIDVKITILLGI